MARASYLQSSFLGGEWSPFMQGRMERQDYRTAMNRALNLIVLEEGSAPRRSGTRFVGPTRRSAPAKLKAFHFDTSSPYVMEFTAGHLRFYFKNSLVLADEGHAVGGVVPGSPAAATTITANDFALGDEVLFYQPDGMANIGIAPLLNRTFYLAGAPADVNHFTFVDTVDLVDLTETVSLAGIGLRVAKVLDYATVYTADQLAAIRTVQDSENVLVLHHDVKPYKVTSVDAVAPSPTATFSYGPAVFTDGPYADPFKDGSTVTPSGLSGSITLTASIGSGDQTPAFTGFATTDVGRMIRLFSEPLDWGSGTSYAAGATVRFNGAYWAALKANSGKQPDLDVTNWSIDTSAAVWTWGRITGYTSPTIVTVAIEPLVIGEDNVASGPLLYTHAIQTWRMGLYSTTSGYPSCGCYHEGRLWLAGAVKNRFDAGVSNQTFNFAPTGRDGTVADQNGISYVFNSKDIQNILWMEPDDQGILAGTKGGEWLIRASSLNDPLTPTSIQAHPTTHEGARDLAPVRTGLALCYVHKHGRKLMEYLANPQPGKFSANNLSLTAKHLSAPGIAEIAYQQELAPVIWARLDDGGLIGCSYRRDDPYGTQPVQYAAWHRHALGHGRAVESLVAGPSVDGTLDSVTIVTKDDAPHYWVEMLADLFDEDTDVTEAFFVDGGSPAVAAEISGSNIVLYGFHYLIGESLSVMIGGLDCGDFTVAAGGTLTVPLGSDAGGLLTEAYLLELTNSGSTFDGLGVTILKTPAGPRPDPTYGSIIRYQDTTGVTSQSGSLPGWDTNRFYAIQTGVDFGLYVFNLATGALLYTKTVTMMGLSFLNVSPMAMDVDEQFMYVVDDASNSGRLNKIRLSDLTVVGSFGTSSSHFGTDDTHFAHPLSMICIKAGSKNFLVSSSLLGLGIMSGNEISIIDTDTMEWTGFVTYLTEERGVVCRGPSFTIGDYGWAQAYVLGHFVTGTGGVPDPMTLYGVVATSTGGTGLYGIGGITPADVDPSWTDWDPVKGLIYDETDGNVIFAVGNLTAYRLVKVSTADASVLWAITVDAVPGGDGSLNTTRCRGGKLVYYTGVGANGKAYQIDTIAGTATTTTVISTPGGDHAYNSDTGQLVFLGSYASGGGAPTPISPTVSASGKYFTFGASGSTPAAVNYFGPLVAGFTFTTQGQIVRPVSPQETGLRSGPGLGNTRRSHMAAALMHRSQGVEWGTVFDNLRPMLFEQPSGLSYTELELWSGIFQATIEDDASYDSMVCWQITRPHPATMLAIEPFLMSEDR